MKTMRHQPSIFAHALLLSLVLGAGQVHAHSSDCGLWNTGGAFFWSGATREDVARCLELGVYPDQRDHEGRTGLHLAAQFNPDADVIKELTDAGTDVNARAEYDRTPLHLAAEHNSNPAVIDALLGAGADIHARDEFGNTPLHRAAKNSVPPMIDALLDAGADPNILTNGKWHAFHIAERKPVSSQQRRLQSTEYILSRAGRAVWGRGPGPVRGIVGRLFA